MIKLRATRTLSGDYGSVRRGELFETSNANAKSLIRRGYAVEAASEKVKPAKQRANA
jgi:hypothetical protein